MIQGFHKITAATYHMDPAASPSLSSSIAQILLRESPRKAWFSHPRLNPNYRESHESKFDLGTCAHAVLLEQDSSNIVVVDADDWRTKAAKEQRDLARTAGKTPLLARHYDDVRNMVDAALAYIEGSDIAEAWHDAESEVTGVWHEKGVWLRCRFDRLAKDRSSIIDYKSTTDASPEGFSRQIQRMNYHLQEAFYRRCIRALVGTDPRCVFLAQEVTPPHDPSLAACSNAMREIADAEVERAIGMWRQCLASGEWPGYPKRICYAEPTSFMIQDHEYNLSIEREVA